MNVAVEDRMKMVVRSQPQMVVPLLTKAPYLAIIGAAIHQSNRAISKGIDLCPDRHSRLFRAVGFSRALRLVLAFLSSAPCSQRAAKALRRLPAQAQIHPPT